MVLLHFVHTPEFDRSAAEVGFDDGKLRKLQQRLCADPRIGNPIPGTGGVRKVRVGGRTKGKRGGYRVIYFFVERRLTVYLLLAYPKGVAENLTDAGKKHAARLARILEMET